jgi:replicative DNA helicase
MTLPLVTPHDLDAERAVLGAVLVEPDLFLEIGDRLTAEDFFRDAHRRIFSAMQDLARERRTIDGLTLKDLLTRRGDLQEVGGPAYLFGLADGMPRSSNITAYAAIVAERAERRRLQSAVRKIAAEADDPAIDTRTVIDGAERTIFAVAEQRRGGDFTDAATWVAEGFSKLEQRVQAKRDGVRGVPTGFTELDEMTCGLQRSTLTLLAARPSMGKTSFATNLALHAAAAGHHVGFFSLEQDRDELLIRAVTCAGRIDGHRLQSGYLNQSEYARMSDALGQIAESCFHLDDSADVGLMQLHGKARRLKARAGLSLIVIDYLQLMRLPRAENRNVAVGEVSRGLKLLARELHVPVVALSQLSRDTERRGGERRPMLSDLRDSGSLEQDADLVLFIHRPEVYDPTPENMGIAQVIIAKHRNGPTGTVRLRWSKESTRFDDLETRSA